MVNFYVFRIKNDLKKYADVPDLWKSKVLAEFKRQVADGEITEDLSGTRENHTRKTKHKGAIKYAKELF